MYFAIYPKFQKGHRSIILKVDKYVNLHHAITTMTNVSIYTTFLGMHTL